MSKKARDSVSTVVFWTPIGDHLLLFGISVLLGHKFVFENRGTVTDDTGHHGSCASRAKNAGSDSGQLRSGSRESYFCSGGW